LNLSAMIEALAYAGRIQEVNVGVPMQQPLQRRAGFLSIHVLVVDRTRTARGRDGPVQTYGTQRPAHEAVPNVPQAPTRRAIRERIDHHDAAHAPVGCRTTQSVLRARTQAAKHQSRQGITPAQIVHGGADLERRPFLQRVPGALLDAVADSTEVEAQRHHTFFGEVSRELRVQSKRSGLRQQSRRDQDQPDIRAPDVRLGDDSR
jgi:hypothetical protein